MDLSPSAVLERARLLLDRAPFVAELGLRLEDVGPGWAETALVIGPRHLQGEGRVHAGVLAAVADHTAAIAAGTGMAEGSGVVSVDIHLHLLRAAEGEGLRCRAQVLGAEGPLHTAEAELFTVTGGERRRVAKAAVALAAVRTAPPAGKGEEGEA